MFFDRLTDSTCSTPNCKYKAVEALVDAKHNLLQSYCEKHIPLQYPTNSLVQRYTTDLRGKRTSGVYITLMNVRIDV